MSDTRELIVVDCETTGLDIERHWVLEVAAINVTTGEEMYFVPALPSGALDGADGQALKINGYFERGVYAHRLSTDTADKHWRQLWRWLKGNTLAGSNPSFDALMLNKAAAWSTIPETYAKDKQPALEPSPWHHRLADLSAFAAGALGLEPTELPGLDKVCKALDVEIDGAHSAMGDAAATAECFRRLLTKKDYAVSLAAVQGKP